MQRNNFIDNIKTGDIGAVRRKLTWNPMSWVSVAVRFFTASRYNHSLIFVWRSDILFVQEAVERGVLTCPFSEWIRKYDHNLLVFRLNRLHKTQQEIELAIHMYEGRPYDFTALIRHQVVYQVCRWFGKEKWIGRTDENKASKKLYCSEHVSLIWGIGQWWTKTTPDILEHEHRNIYRHKVVNKNIVQMSNDGGY